MLDNTKARKQRQGNWTLVFQSLQQFPEAKEIELKLV